VRRPLRPRLAAFALAAFAPLGGCRNLDRFDTDGSAAFCGSMVSAPFANEGFSPSGPPRDLRMRLELDVDRLQSAPGTLTTDDAGHGICGDAPLFDGAALRGIPEMQHDPLSTLSFLESSDYDFFAWVDSSCAGTLVSVVSLMKDDDVQVRLLKPAPEAATDAGAAERPGFASFRLARRARGCDF